MRMTTKGRMRNQESGKKMRRMCVCGVSVMCLWCGVGSVSIDVCLFWVNADVDLHV